MCIIIVLKYNVHCTKYQDTYTFFNAYTMGSTNDKKRLFSRGNKHKNKDGIV